MDSASQSISEPKAKRQYRTAEERRRIVEETLAPGTSVARVARAHGVNANQVFAWRKLYRAGLLRSAETDEAGASGVRLLPVAVSADLEQPVPVVVTKRAGQERRAAASPGSIELSLAKARVRIFGKVDSDVLRVVLEYLRG